MSTVTVVIPTIPGRERLLNRAMTSVHNQRRPADALVVEADPGRSGAAATRNRALERVETDWVAWLDDDDELLPNHLDVLLRYAGDADLVYPTPQMVGGRDPTAVAKDGVWRRPWGVHFGPEQEHHIRTHGSFIPMTHMVRTEAVQDVGGFPPGVTLPDGRYSGEDERYLIQLLDAGMTFMHVNVITWLWHVHDSNTAGKGNPA